MIVGAPSGSIVHSKLTVASPGPSLLFACNVTVVVSAWVGVPVTTASVSERSSRCSPFGRPSADSSCMRSPVIVSGAIAEPAALTCAAGCAIEGTASAFDRPFEGRARLSTPSLFFACRTTVGDSAFVGVPVTRASVSESLSRSRPAGRSSELSCAMLLPVMVSGAIGMPAWLVCGAGSAIDGAASTTVHLNLTLACSLSCSASRVTSVGPELARRADDRCFGFRFDFERKPFGQAARFQRAHVFARDGHGRDRDAHRACLRSAGCRDDGRFRRLRAPRHHPDEGGERQKSPEQLEDAGSAPA